MPDVEELLHQARKSFAENDHGEALRLCEHLKQIAPDRPEPHNIIGKVHYARMDFITALKHFEQAQGIDPRHVNSAWNIANALFYLGRLGDASAAYGRVLGLDGPAELHMQARTMITHIERMKTSRGSAASG